MAYAISSMATAHLSGAQQRRLIGAPPRRAAYSLDRRRLFTVDGWPVQTAALAGYAPNPCQTYQGARPTNRGISGIFDDLFGSSDPAPATGTGGTPPDLENDPLWADLVKKIIDTGGQVAPSIIKAYADMHGGNSAADLAEARRRAALVNSGQAKMPGGASTGMVLAIGAVVLMGVGYLVMKRRGRR